MQIQRNDICSRSGFCYEVNDQTDLIEPDPQRDPNRYPAQPG